MRTRGLVQFPVERFQRGPLSPRRIFEDASQVLRGKRVLFRKRGVCRPGQVLACHGMQCFRNGFDVFQRLRESSRKCIGPGFFGLEKSCRRGLGRFLFRSLGQCPRQLFHALGRSVQVSPHRLLERVLVVQGVSRGDPQRRVLVQSRRRDRSGGVHRRHGFFQSLHRSTGRHHAWRIAGQRRVQLFKGFPPAPGCDRSTVFQHLVQLLRLPAGLPEPFCGRLLERRHLSSRIGWTGCLAGFLVGLHGPGHGCRLPGQLPEFVDSLFFRCELVLVASQGFAKILQRGRRLRGGGRSLPGQGRLEPIGDQPVRLELRLPQRIPGRLDHGGFLRKVRGGRGDVGGFCASPLHLPQETTRGFSGRFHLATGVRDEIGPVGFGLSRQHGFDSRRCGPARFPEMSRGVPGLCLSRGRDPCRFFEFFAGDPWSLRCRPLVIVFGCRPYRCRGRFLHVPLTDRLLRGGDESAPRMPVRFLLAGQAEARRALQRPFQPRFELRATRFPVLRLRHLLVGLRRIDDCRGGQGTNVFVDRVQVLCRAFEIAPRKVACHFFDRLQGRPGRGFRALGEFFLQQVGLRDELPRQGVGRAPGLVHLRLARRHRLQRLRGLPHLLLQLRILVRQHRRDRIQFGGHRGNLQIRQCLPGLLHAFRESLGTVFERDLVHEPAGLDPERAEFLFDLVGGSIGRGSLDHEVLHRVQFVPNGRLVHRGGDDARRPPIGVGNKPVSHGPDLFRISIQFLLQVLEALDRLQERVAALFPRSDKTGSLREFGFHVGLEKAEHGFFVFPEQLPRPVRPGQAVLEGLDLFREFLCLFGPRPGRRSRRIIPLQRAGGVERFLRLSSRVPENVVGQLDEGLFPLLRESSRKVRTDIGRFPGKVPGRLAGAPCFQVPGLFDHFRGLFARTPEPFQRVQRLHHLRVKTFPGKVLERLLEVIEFRVGQFPVLAFLEPLDQSLGTVQVHGGERHVRARHRQVRGSLFASHAQGFIVRRVCLTDLLLSAYHLGQRIGRRVHAFFPQLLEVGGQRELVPGARGVPRLVRDLDPGLVGQSARGSLQLGRRFLHVLPHRRDLAGIFRGQRPDPFGQTAKAVADAADAFRHVPGEPCDRLPRQVPLAFLVPRCRLDPSRCLLHRVAHGGGVLLRRIQVTRSQRLVRRRHACPGVDEHIVHRPRVGALVQRVSVHRRFPNVFRAVRDTGQGVTECLHVLRPLSQRGERVIGFLLDPVHVLGQLVQSAMPVHVGHRRGELAQTPRIPVRHGLVQGFRRKLEVCRVHRVFHVLRLPAKVVRHRVTGIPVQRPIVLLHLPRQVFHLFGERFHLLAHQAGQAVQFAVLVRLLAERGSQQTDSRVKRVRMIRKEQARGDIRHVRQVDRLPAEIDGPLSLNIHVREVDRMQAGLQGHASGTIAGRSLPFPAGHPNPVDHQE